MTPRILIASFSVCPAPDRHGVGMLHVLKALAPRYAVDVLTLRTADLPFVERLAKARMLRVPVGQGTLIERVEAFRRAVRRQLEGEEYEVVHLRSAWGGRAVVTDVCPPTKIVYEVVRAIEGEPRAADVQLSAELLLEEAEVLARADLVLLPHAGARAHLEGRGHADKLELVPPGVDVDHFDWEPAPSDGGPPRVLFAGKLTAGRGLRLLARAVGRVKANRPVRLSLAGPADPAFVPLLDEALAQSGLGQADVERLGPIDPADMPRLIAQAAVCVAPAAADPAERPLAGFPTKLLEYLACRRPVVAPRRPAVEEVVRDGQEGLLFVPNDELGLAAAIERLLADPVRADELAQAGRQRVRERYPASHTRRRLLECYARILPAASWAPPGPAVGSMEPIEAHPDTTTARRAIPVEEPERARTVPPSIDGRAEGELSGEIVIDDLRGEIPVTVGEVLVDVLDSATAGPLEAKLPATPPPPRASAEGDAGDFGAPDYEEEQTEPRSLHAVKPAE